MTIDNLLTLIIAILSLLGFTLGIRAEFRAHSEKKRKQLSDKAQSYNSLDQIMNLGKSLAIHGPSDLSNTNIEQSKDTLQKLSQLSKESVPIIASSFPGIVPFLGKISWRAEQLSKVEITPLDLSEDDWILRQFCDLYDDLYMLSLQGITRGEITDNLSEPDRVFDRDPFMKTFYNRFMAFTVIRLGKYRKD